MDGKKRKRRAGALAVLALAAALLLSSLADYGYRSAAVRRGVLRLHITANSDGEADQAVKLLVRDAVLREGAAVFGGAETEAEAEEKIGNALPMLARTAARVLAENGFSYGARAEIVREFFDARAYGDVTFPAGTYTAVRIRLGTGEGKNWWCVMFPPLCLPAARQKTDDSVYAVFNGRGAEIVAPKDGYRIRFKVVEAVERLLEKLK